jgi:cyclopropane-fatty-acyl-phospholipid synthase
MWYVKLAQTNRMPDGLMRLGIRAMLRYAAWQRRRLGVQEQSAAKSALIRKLRASPIAIHTDDANRQHYEVPSSFFQTVLGSRLKYSCCYWPQGVETLDVAEEAMLELTCQRARLEDGMTVLDLGCGWGSLALWIAERYPNSRVVAVSNSRTQRAYIEARSRECGLQNVEALTADVNDLLLERRFERVISIEMFEHMKNYEALMRRIAGMLKPAGMLFVHIFCHREFAYEFDVRDSGDWMAQTYFSGGTMPSDDLLLYFQRDLVLVDHWRLSGTHYARTLRAWLDKLDRQGPLVRDILADAYGPDHVTKELVNWRLFFLVCEETFGQNRGRDYLVSHYLFEKRGDAENAG